MIRIIFFIIFFILSYNIAINISNLFFNINNINLIRIFLRSRSRSRSRSNNCPREKNRSLVFSSKWSSLWKRRIIDKFKQKHKQTNDMIRIGYVHTGTVWVVSCHEYPPQKFSQDKQLLTPTTTGVAIRVNTYA